MHRDPPLPHPRYTRQWNLRLPFFYQILNGAGMQITCFCLSFSVFVIWKDSFMGGCIIYGRHGDIFSGRKGRSLNGNRAGVGMSHLECCWSSCCCYCKQTFTLLSSFSGGEQFYSVQYLYKKKSRRGNFPWIEKNNVMCFYQSKYQPLRLTIHKINMYVLVKAE